MRMLFALRIILRTAGGAGFFIGMPAFALKVPDDVPTWLAVSLIGVIALGSLLTLTMGVVPWVKLTQRMERRTYV